MNIQTIEIPRTVLEAGVLSCDFKGHRVITRVIAINNPVIYATNGKRMFRATLHSSLSNKATLSKPICLFAEKVEIALKQLKQTMGRNAKQIETILITYDPANPYIANLSIGQTSSRYNPTLSMQSLKIPVDLADSNDTEDVLKMFEKLFDAIQNNSEVRQSLDKDRAKFCYHLPLLNYLLKVLDIMNIDFLSLKQIKINDDSCFTYSYETPDNEDNDKPIYLSNLSVSIMGLYD